MTFFKHREGSPLTSILIPTRGKPDSLYQAIESIYNLATDKSLLEFILKIDTDDAPTIDLFHKLETQIPIRATISPRGRGYGDMHLWVDEMSKMAMGDWLYIFNDDARMLTPRWDEMLFHVQIIDARPGTEDVCCMFTPTKDRPAAKEFMFLRRTTFEILGHWSLCPFIDYWIRTVMERVGVCYALPILVEHLNGAGNTDVGIPEAEEMVSSTRALRLLIQDQLTLLDYIDKAIAERPDWDAEAYYYSCIGMEKKPAIPISV